MDEGAEIKEGPCPPVGSQAVSRDSPAVCQLPGAASRSGGRLPEIKTCLCRL